MAYGYGWRMADVDGSWNVWHTGTLGGMYSMLSLLPDRKNGFVFMINGEAEDARTVLGEVLTKHFTAPGRHARRGVVCRCAGQGASAAIGQLVGAGYVRAAARRHRRTGQLDGPLPRPVVRRDHPVSTPRPDPFRRDEVAQAVGHRDAAGRALPDSLGQPRCRHGRVAAPRTRPRAVQPATLRMAKLDPKGDFSSDYEDLLFQRIGDCP